MSISLSANEMAMIERAAAPLDRNRRDAFIEAILAALEGCPELGLRHPWAVALGAPMRSSG
jgi:hypothetical protein